MTERHVETISKRGQWVSRIPGESEHSQSYASRDEAVAAGRELAEELGIPHRVHDSEATGVATDEQSEADADAARNELLPDTTDEQDRPIDNPSG